MCIVRVWALRLTWTFVFATLFAKMYRVWRLFVVNRKIRRMTISNVKLLRIVGALMAIQLVRTPHTHTHSRTSLQQPTLVLTTSSCR